MFFGLKSLKDAWDMPSLPPGSKQNQSAEISELSEAEEFIKKSEVRTLTVLHFLFSSA